ncbi:MAG: RDD family protein [Bacteroidales bacterium]|nr:RDD family protein [Bacteroidales bacterium]
MRKELKQHIENFEFDITSEKFEKILIDQDDLKKELKGITDQWERFKRGISIGVYTLDQVKSSMKRDFLNLFDKVDFDNIRTYIPVQRNEKPNISSTYTTKDNIRENSEFVFVGFWKRVLIKIVDSMIALAFLPLINTILIFSLNKRTIVPIILSSFLFIIIQIFLVTKYGGTIGKLLLRVRIINSNGEYLNVEKAILRDLPYIFISGLSIIPYYMVLNGINDQLEISSYKQIVFLLSIHASSFYKYYYLINLFVIVDVLTVAFNKKKRAIHDFIAGSFVVTRDSLPAKENQ